MKSCKRIEQLCITAAALAGMSMFPAAAMAQTDTYSSQSDQNPAQSSQDPSQASQDPSQKPSQSSQKMTRHHRRMSHAEVRQVQQKLKDQGYYKGQIDGIDGSQTRAAIREFQKSQNLTATGRMDHQTLSQLGVTPRGMGRSEAARSMEESESAIRSAQQKLTDQNLYSGPVNGKMDTATRDALKRFQKDHNLPQTGELNQKTAHALGISTTPQQ